MLKYLGKRFLYRFLKTLDFEGIPLFTEFEYGKFNGDEWLKNADFEVLCVRGKFIYVMHFTYINRDGEEIF